MGCRVAALDPFAPLDLPPGRQQLVAPRLVQEQLERVRGRAGELAVDEGRLVLVQLPAVIAELDAPLLELLVELRQIVSVELELLDELAELRQVDAALLLGLVDQRCQSVHADSHIRVARSSSSLTSGASGYSKPQYLAVLGHGQKPRVR